MCRTRDVVFFVALLSTALALGVAIRSWTTIPENWEQLRRAWEYSHAVGAAFQVLAMSALIVAALARTRN